jgi:RHS repeat-associated protein
VVLTLQPGFSYSSTNGQPFSVRLSEGTVIVQPDGVYNRELNARLYELKDHLGNVRTLVTDVKQSTLVSNVPGTYEPQVVAANNYFPFGMDMPNRVWSSVGSYRYGFNGKEKDNSGEWGQTSYDYGFRIYNPAMGRFLSTDPLTKSFPMLTPYQFASNTPVAAIDIDGLEAYITINSPYFKNLISEAYQNGNTDEAVDLAFRSLMAQRPHDDYAKKAFRGKARAGDFGWESSTPFILTVKDQDGEEIFHLVEKGTPRILQKEESGFWSSVLSLFSFFGSGKGETQENGIAFFAEGGKGGTKTRSLGKNETLDITTLLGYLSATKFGPEGGAPKTNWGEFAKDLTELIETGKDVRANIDTYNNKRMTLIKQKFKNRLDSGYCNLCGEAQSEQHIDKVNKQPGKLRHMKEADSKSGQ